MVTDWLTDSNSHCYITQNADGTIKDFIFVNGDQPIQTATQAMRINASGLGFSKTGVNGPYTNAFVFDSTKGGHLVADFITAGSMLADRIQGGTLESINSTTVEGVTYKNFSLDMTTGLLKALKLVIDTPNFKLSEQGVVTATGASINGAVATVSGGYKTQLTGGKVQFSYNDVLSAEMSANTVGGIYLKTSDPSQSQARLEVYGAVECSDLLVYKRNASGYPSGNGLIQVDGDRSSPSVHIGMDADYVYIGNFADYGSSIYIGAGTMDNSIIIGNQMSSTYLRLYCPTGGLLINGQQAASGHFIDRGGNTVYVENGLIVGGVS